MVAIEPDEKYEFSHTIFGLSRVASDSILVARRSIESSHSATHTARESQADDLSRCVNRPVEEGFDSEL